MPENENNLFNMSLNNVDVEFMDVLREQPPKLVPKKPKPVPMKIGAEIEFWARNGVTSDVYYKYAVIDEYYSGMYELNNFISDFSSEKEIYSFLTKVADTANEIKDKAYEHYNYDFRTKGIKIDDRCIAFNGLHLHISLGSSANTYDFANSLMNSRIIEHFKLDNYPSLRSMYSHHIWGYLRDYSYDYKSKEKFRPVIWVDRLGTVELRIFDNEDIMVKTRRKKVSRFIWNTISNFIKTGNTGTKKSIPEFSSGEDIENLSWYCKSTFSKGKNNFRFKNNVLTSPAGQEFELMEDYISIIKGDN